MKNKIKLFAVFALLLISTASFAFAKSDFSISPFFSSFGGSNQNVEFKKASVEKIDRMFWKISGTDKKGRPSYVYLLGTIHVGDDKLFPLPDSIMNAFSNAKRVAAEISEEDMENAQSAVAAAMGKSYMNAGGRNVLDYLTEDEKKVLEALFGDKATLEQVGVFEPWVMMIMTSTGQLSQVGMTGEGGVDLYLMNLLSDEGRSWEGMDTLQTQLDILAFGDYEQQIYMLKESIASIAEPKESTVNMADLYTAYLDDDVETLAKLLEAELKDDDVPPEMEDFVNSYYKALMDDRNSAWAKKIDSWIKEGGSTFIFTGCAHFIGDHSVFHYLKENNTIE